MKLVNDGHALAYASPERAALRTGPYGATGSHGTTLEPVGFAYNKELLAKGEVPRTHADFIRLLRAQPQRLQAGRLSTWRTRAWAPGRHAERRASGMLWEVGARAQGGSRPGR